MFSKLGRRLFDEDRGPYPGGVAFETIDEARDRITRKQLMGYEVWGLDCSLANTYTRDGQRYIIESTRLLPLD